MIFTIKKKIRALTYQSLIFKKFYLFLNRMKMLLTRYLSDDAFAKLKYKENTGLTLDLENPKTFNEKLWWLKINHRTSLMTQCSDKAEVRQYLKDLDLGHILTDVQGIYDNPHDVPFEQLEGKFFIKTNHGSGTNLFYDSSKAFDQENFIKLFEASLSKNYYWQSREWNYKNIKPRIIVEKLIESEEPLLDYRFFCFHGKVKLIFVDIETAAADGTHNPHAMRNIYDREFNLQDFTVGRKNFDTNLVKKPDNLEEMIAYVEKIASPFIFCRVDLYNIKGKILFGEITFYPGGATQQFSSKQKDLEIGQWINLK